MADNGKPVLSAEGVAIHFGGLVALNEVTFTVNRGSITAIIGPNGAGKTTLFNCITGFYRPTSGRIIFHADGRQSQVQTLPIHKIARLGIARTYQNIRLFAEMSVLENLLVAQHQTVNHQMLSGIFRTRAFRSSEQEALERAWYWLAFTGLTTLANQQAGTLAYGQQRRLEVARAMATRPALICLDEPAAGLNDQETQDLNGLILRLRDEERVSVLLIEHHMGVVMKISDHVVVMDYGEIISTGTPAEMQNDPAVIKAYLGEPEKNSAAGNGPAPKGRGG